MLPFYKPTPDKWYRDRNTPKGVLADCRCFREVGFFGDQHTCVVGCPGANWMGTGENMCGGDYKFTGLELGPVSRYRGTVPSNEGDDGMGRAVCGKLAEVQLPNGQYIRNPEVSLCEQYKKWKGYQPVQADKSSGLREGWYSDVPTRYTDQLTGEYLGESQEGWKCHSQWEHVCHDIYSNLFQTGAEEEDATVGDSPEAGQAPGPGGSSENSEEGSSEAPEESLVQRWRLFRRRRRYFLFQACSWRQFCKYTSYRFQKWYKFTERFSYKREARTCAMGRKYKKETQQMRKGNTPLLKTFPYTATTVVDPAQKGPRTPNCEAQRVDPAKLGEKKEQAQPDVLLEASTSAVQADRVEILMDADAPHHGTIQSHEEAEDWDTFVVTSGNGVQYEVPKNEINVAFVHAPHEQGKASPRKKNRTISDEAFKEQFPAVHEQIMAFWKAHPKDGKKVREYATSITRGLH